MDGLYKMNIKGKLYKLIYEPNKDTRIKVRTAVGESTLRETGEGKTQGSSEAGIASSEGLGKGVDAYFESSAEELSCGTVDLLPQIFQGDLCCLYNNPLSVQLC